jgi:hypothetical protein
MRSVSACRDLDPVPRRDADAADRVLRVVSNLVENALRLTPGGEVRVVAAPGMLRVETGPGSKTTTGRERSSASTCTSGTGASGPLALGSVSQS